MTGDNASQGQCPAWLATLTEQYRAGLIPPAGLVWEDPPAERRPAWPGATGTGVPAAPMMPTRTRRDVVAYLRRHPGRWARVHDAHTDASSLVDLQAWFRKNMFPLTVGGETAIRRVGRSRALYVRMVDSDIYTDALPGPDLHLDACTETDPGPDPGLPDSLDTDPGQGPLP